MQSFTIGLQTSCCAAFPKDKVKRFFEVKTYNSHSYQMFYFQYFRMKLRGKKCNCIKIEGRM